MKCILRWCAAQDKGFFVTSARGSGGWSAVRALGLHGFRGGRFAGNADGNVTVALVQDEIADGCPLLAREAIREQRGHGGESSSAQLIWRRRHARSLPSVRPVSLSRVRLPTSSRASTIERSRRGFGLAGRESHSIESHSARPDQNDQHAHHREQARDTALQASDLHLEIAEFGVTRMECHHGCSAATGANYVASTRGSRVSGTERARGPRQLHRGCDGRSGGLACASAA
jgi:hypothetical protein